MVTIRITDITTQPSTYEDGQRVFDLIVDEVVHDHAVTVSFDGVVAVPSAFINAAFVQLVERAPLEQVKRNLRITDSTKFINDMIRGRFDFIASQSRY